MITKLIEILQYVIISLLEETVEYIKSLPTSFTRQKIKRLYQPKLWVYIFIILLILNIIKNDRIMSIICLTVIAFLGVLRAEQTGNYIHWHRQRRLKKAYEQQENKS